MLRAKNTACLARTPLLSVHPSLSACAGFHFPPSSSTSSLTQSLFASNPTTTFLLKPNEELNISRDKSSLAGWLKTRRIQERAKNKKVLSKNQRRKLAERLAKEKEDDKFRDQIHGTRCKNDWLAGRVIWFEAENKDSGVDFLTVVEGEKEKEEAEPEVETARFPDSNKEVVVLKQRPKKKRTTVAV